MRRHSSVRLGPCDLDVGKKGVAEQRAAYLGSPASLPEALGDLGGLLSFWSELDWVTQRGAVPVALRTTEGSGRPSTETSPRKEEEEEV
ncbi:jg20274 [Pararge aegeria aegeria]|uniref:Jg20274 protein n=1 Tax=Pararge aegeria aegeria TaxID=348720 RepID=A0A8S4R3F7_9NEOP|nr:jg20274 [Pararge aegeria aegeria]